MKSNPVNAPNNPTASASSGPPNPCLERAANTAALKAVADDGISYLLPYSQFLYAERSANAALEKQPDAPPERMLIRFASGDVAILGSGLKRVETDIQRYELQFIKAADRRLAATLETHIAAVTVTLTKENV